MDNYIFNSVNENCYHFKTIKNKNGLYDSFVDMTYVLLMENSEREKHVYDQLEKFQPTKTVKVQYNKGYKKCKKQLCENKVNWDLFDAHYNVILDAYRNNYNNILILEDDFVINEALIFDREKVEDIKKFIRNNEVDVYLLGTISPINNLGKKQGQCNGLFNMPCYGAHGYIMNSMGIEKFLDYYNTMDCNEAGKLSSNGHIDAFYNKSFNTYLNKDPLIVQPLEMTENRKENWSPNKLHKYVSNLNINLFDLDNKDDDEIVNAYENRIIFANILKVVMYLVIAIVIYCICKN